MKVLVIGSGGREHAIVAKLSESKMLTALYCAPGNPGIADFAELVNIKVDQIAELKSFAQENKIDLTIVGPELPLTLGIVDLFEAAGLKIFGPCLAGAQLEGSKAFSKEVMLAAGVPTANYQAFDQHSAAASYLQTSTYPIVLKADGLAAGKGVVIVNNWSEAIAALDFVFNELGSSKIVIEDFLHGDEASLIVMTDGERIVPLCVSNDYKTIFEGNLGANTGGMGTVSPTKHLPSSLENVAIDLIIRPVLSELKKRGIIYRGFLYAGLMISADNSLNVIEFNARCGDPETQVIMARLQGDLLAVIDNLSSKNKTDLPEIFWSPDYAVCLVLAAQGYPENPVGGHIITGIAEAQKEFAVNVWQAGTKLDASGKLVTAGGRVLNVVSTAATLGEARQIATAAAERIHFEGKQFRRDIGLSYCEIRAAKV